MTQTPLKASSDGWEIHYSGGRTADIHARGRGAIDCVQVCHYDWVLGVPSDEPTTAAELLEHLQFWIADRGADFERNGQGPVPA